MTFWFEYHQDGIFLPSAEGNVASSGITIGSRLTFYSHLKQLCKKIANKLNALTKIAPYLSYKQRRLICSSFSLGN